MGQVDTLIANQKNNDPAKVAITLRLPESQVTLIDEYVETLGVNRQVLIAAMVSDGLEILKEKMKEEGHHGSRRK